VLASLTVCVDVYVPGAGLKVGVAATGGAVIVYTPVATALVV
jgi:hypothetical protein